MRVKQYLRWELLLALSLVGCTSVVPNRIGLPSAPTKGAAEAPSSVAVPGLNLGTRLLFQVRWPAKPGYDAQALPGGTEKIEVKVVKGGLDPAVAASLVKAETMNRPTQGDTTTATFNLDPALKEVDVYVQALSASGTMLASGRHLGVPVRDNTSTGVTVTLVPSEEVTAVEEQLKIRVADHLALLRDLPVYFKDYDQLVKYSDSAEGSDLISSLKTTFGEWLPRGSEAHETKPSESPGPDGSPSPDASPKPVAYRVASRYTTQSVPERLFNPSNASQSMEVLAGALQKLYWPGYVANFTYSEDATKHALQVEVLPDLGGGDGTRANLQAELSATSWETEPSLTPTMDFLLSPTESNRVTRQVTFLGGKRPVDSTINGAKLAFTVVPKGNSVNTFSIGVAADTMRDISNTPLYLALTERNVGARQVTRAPKHVQFTAMTPPVAATADLTVNDDFLGLKSKTDLRFRKNAGGFGAFLLELGGTMRLGPIGDHSEPVNVNVGFTLLDPAKQLRLEGSLQVQRIPFKALLNARFVDVPSNTVVGTIDYNLPVDATGRVDMNHLESWPILKLVDTQNTPIRLTPGFFSGETNGFVRVDVR